MSRPDDKVTPPANGPLDGRPIPAKPRPLIDELPESAPITKPLKPTVPQPLQSTASPQDVVGAQARMRQAHILRTRGDLPGAAREVMAAIEISPNDATAYAMLGDIQKQAGRPKNALRSYETAKELLPTGSARTAVEAKIARTAIESMKSRSASDNAPVERASAGTIVTASLLAPGLGQFIAGKPLNGGCQFGVWLIATIASARTPQASDMMNTLLHRSLSSPPPSAASNIFADLLLVVSTGAWLYSVVDAVLIARQSKKGTTHERPFQ